MRIALVTIVHGRHEHLRRQLRWVAALDPQPSDHVVVSMGDPAIRGLVGAAGEVVELPVVGELPLAAARNTGVAVAGERGAHAVVLLDVDCLPHPELVGDYERALRELSGRTAVVSGRVKYLPRGMRASDYVPELVDRMGRDHAARTVPEGTTLEAGDPRMLWSLNIAATVDSWHRVGGFDERYVGYGGEDTDFGQRLAAAHGTMFWSGRACAYHQYHSTVTPPVQHARAIARNANIFRSTWGFDPMEGWLAQLRERGYLVWSEEGWQATGRA